MKTEFIYFLTMIFGVNSGVLEKELKKVGCELHKANMKIFPHMHTISPDPCAGLDVNENTNAAGVEKWDPVSPKWPNLDLNANTNNKGWNKAFSGHKELFNLPKINLTLPKFEGSLFGKQERNNSNGISSVNNGLSPDNNTTNTGPISDHQAPNYPTGQNHFGMGQNFPLPNPNSGSPNFGFPNNQNSYPHNGRPDFNNFGIPFGQPNPFHNNLGPNQGMYPGQMYPNQLRPNFNNLQPNLYPNGYGFNNQMYPSNQFIPNGIQNPGQNFPNFNTGPQYPNYFGNNFNRPGYQYPNNGQPNQGTFGGQYPSGGQPNSNQGVNVNGFGGQPNGINSNGLGQPNGTYGQGTNFNELSNQGGNQGNIGQPNVRSNSSGLDGQPNQGTYGQGTNFNGLSNQGSYGQNQFTGQPNPKVEQPIQGVNTNGLGAPQPNVGNNNGTNGQVPNNGQGNYGGQNQPSQGVTSNGLSKPNGSGYQNPSVGQSNVTSSSNNVLFPDSLPTSVDRVFTKPNASSTGGSNFVFPDNELGASYLNQPGGRRILKNDDSTTIKNIPAPTGNGKVIDNVAKRRKNNDDYSEETDDNRKNESSEEIIKIEITTRGTVVAVPDGGGKTIINVKANCPEGWIADRNGVCREQY